MNQLDLHQARKTRGSLKGIEMEAKSKIVRFMDHTEKNEIQEFFNSKKTQDSKT